MKTGEDIFERHFSLWKRLIRVEAIWFNEIKSRESKSPERCKREFQLLQMCAQQIDDAYWDYGRYYGYPQKSDLFAASELIYGSLNLAGIEPLSALVEEAREFIDAIFIGSSERASEILARDSKLLDAARNRMNSASKKNAWKRKMEKTIALSEALAAKIAVDEVLESKGNII